MNLTPANWITLGLIACTMVGGVYVSQYQLQLVQAHFAEIQDDHDALAEDYNQFRRQYSAAEATEAANFKLLEERIKNLQILVSK